MNGIGGNLDKNVEGEEVPNARNWWEPGGPLPFYVPLDLLLQISQRRREGEDPEYWRRVRREQREAMRREEAERQAREEALRSGEQGEGRERPGEEENSKDDQMAEGVDGGDQVARQVEGVILEEDDDREGDFIEADVGVLNEEIGEQQEILETVEVTKKVEGGDAGTEELAGTEEIQVGELIFGLEELEGLLEDGGNEDNEVEREAFEGENEAVDQGKDKMDNQIMSRPHVNRQFVTVGEKKATDLPILEKDRNESQTDNGSNAEDPEPEAEKKHRKPVIIPDNITVLQDNPPMYQCNICQKSFKTKANLKYHLFHGQPDTAKPFQCQVCKKGFISKGYYKAHLRHHGNPRPYKCTICNMAFVQKCHLKQHLGSHTKERPFTCEECHRGFSSKQALRNHSLVHSGVKDFPCPVCDKRFALPGNLKKHTAVHTSERNFGCHICGKGFTSKGYLAQHLKIHTDQRNHECGQCSKTFLRKQQLHRHLLVHADERPFRSKCALCQMVFIHKEYLARHLKNCHKQSKDATKKVGNEAGQAKLCWNI